MKQRSLFWDNYKGLLIFLVVFGHFIYSCATAVSGGVIHQIFTFIYLFHMPAFIFCSGYFSKSERSRGAARLIKLLLYYLVFNTAMMLYYAIFQGQSPSLLTPYSSYWYLLSLICWRLCADRLSKVKGILPLSIAAALLVGFWSEFSNFLSLARTVAFFPFFLLGYRFEPEKLRRPKGNVGKILCAVLAAGFMVLLLLFAGKIDLSVDLLCAQPYTAATQMVWRAVIMVSAVLAIAALLFLVPDKRIPLLTAFGKNSLLIYLGHRFFVLIFDALVPVNTNPRLLLLIALPATLVTTLVLGNDPLNRWTAAQFTCAAEAICKADRLGRKLLCVILVLAVLIGASHLPGMIINKLNEPEPVDVPTVIDNSVVLSFVGDLVLLKEQVPSAWNEETQDYDFSEMFRYAAPYLSQADLAIGVLEGPLAGEAPGYSTSDYDDGIPFYLNFPDSFARDIKASGIDLVTTANNHLLDMGADGAMRTLDVLDEAGLQHTGSYRDEAERNALLLMEAGGLQIAVLSYTQMVNGYSVSDMVGMHPHMTAMLPAPSDPNYETLLSQIEGDFEKAKRSGADLIVVLPHMGTQFSHETDSFQDHWNRLFADLGADLILGNHAHAVQPLEYIDDTLVINCPGNFADGFTGYDSDAKALIEVYLDRTTGQVKGAAVIPMYTQEMEKGFYRALPIYDALQELRNDLPSRDLDRMKEVHALVTQVMLGQKISISNIQQRYFFAGGRYCPYTE